jgi:DNA-binding NarL/FixJ family response regulator
MADRRLPGHHGAGRCAEERRMTTRPPTPTRPPHACVVAVDDHASFRAVVRQVVTATDALTIVGEADCGEAAVELVRDLQPDVVLMDVRMPGLGGIAATRRIKAMQPRTLVVLVTTIPPAELPGVREESLADEVVWKSELRPKLLDEIWRRHGPRRAPVA